MSLETQHLAWLVWETVDRLQRRGTTVRLVVPSDQEVLRQLDPTLTEHELLAAEEYLLEPGHIAPANLGLTWAAYTITNTGLNWLAEGFPWPAEAVQTAAAVLERAESRGPMAEALRNPLRGLGGGGCSGDSPGPERGGPSP